MPQRHGLASPFQLCFKDTIGASVLPQQCYEILKNILGVPS